MDFNIIAFFSPIIERSNMTCTAKRLLDYLYREESVRGNRYHQSHGTLLSNMTQKGEK